MAAANTLVLPLLLVKSQANLSQDPGSCMWQMLFPTLPSPNLPHGPMTRTGELAAALVGPLTRGPSGFPGPGPLRSATSIRHPGRLLQQRPNGPRPAFSPREAGGCISPAPSGPWHRPDTQPRRLHKELRGAGGCARSGVEQPGWYWARSMGEGAAF